jgi:hypothetical protein
VGKMAKTAGDKPLNVGFDGGRETCVFVHDG